MAEKKFEESSLIRQTKTTQILLIAIILRAKVCQNFHYITTFNSAICQTLALQNSLHVLSPLLKFTLSKQINCILLQCTLFCFTDGHDFISGRYNATFAPGATTATVNIPIVDDTIDEPNNETFNLRLYIDGAGYQLGLYKGDTSKATVSILGILNHKCLHDFVWLYLENSTV